MFRSVVSSLNSLFRFKGITYERWNDYYNSIFIPDEDKLFANAQPDPDWEQFAIVAADLLERIQSSLSYNNSAYASSEEAVDDDDDDDFLNDQAINMSKTSFKMWLANS